MVDASIYIDGTLWRYRSIKSRFCTCPLYLCDILGGFNMAVILGVSAFYHDSAAALIVNGNIVAAAQEERFSRIRHDAAYPRQAVDYVLGEKNLTLDDVDFIAFYDKPFLKFERLLETYIAFAPRGFKSFCMAIPLWLREKLFQKKQLQKWLHQCKHPKVKTPNTELE